MAKDQTDTAVDRMSNLAVESTQTLVDAAYLAQRQSAQLLQAWLNTLDTNQKQQREIATRLVQQAQEAQQLLQQYAQESFRSTVDTFARSAQTGFQQASSNLNSAAQQANTASKRAESNVK
ncbi:MAG: hypothetical protein JOZ41_12545 [Chloroflexi bacterium]|nr:hypothetical protein [Chloroflexota bacterium]